MARFVSSPETFFVEEIPAYLPTGEGDHTYVWIEKRNLTTLDAINRLARVLGVENSDVGYAGMKDRRATTRQWLSLPGWIPRGPRKRGSKVCVSWPRLGTETNCVLGTCTAIVSRSA